LTQARPAAILNQKKPATVASDGLFG
jgi:hypothetical protein